MVSKNSLMRVLTENQIGEGEISNWQDLLVLEKTSEKNEGAP